MRLVGLVWLLLVGSIAGAVPLARAPTNLDFEHGLEPWTMRAAALTAGYAFALDDHAYEGTHALRISHPGPIAGQAYGSVVQTFDAADFRGKTVVLRARLSTAPAEGKSRPTVGMFIRIDDDAGQAIAADTTEGRTVCGSAWHDLSVRVAVGGAAHQIMIGFILHDRGTAFVDDISMGVPAPVASTRAPSARGLENLVAFAKLYGLVRWFHPSDAVADTDWDALAVEGVRAVEDARSDEDLIARLRSLFSTIAPSMQLEGHTLAHVIVPPSGTKTTAWLHHGYDATGCDELYSRERPVSAIEGRVVEADVHRLAPHVWAAVPRRLFVDGAGHTMPASSAPRLRSVSADSALDRPVRLADIVILWNIVEHFGAFHVAASLRWDDELAPALARAAAAASECELLDQLRVLLAATKDGHVRVVHGCDVATQAPPLALDWVEGRPIVATSKDPGLRAGDELLALDGAPIDEVMARRLGRIAASTPQDARVQLLGELLGGPPRSTLELVVKREGKPLHVRATRVAITEDLFPEARVKTSAELAPGVWYVDVDRATDEEFTALVPTLARAKAIVFDLRGYPSVDLDTFLPHLSARGLVSPDWKIPDYTEPDRAGVTFPAKPNHWTIPPRPPVFPGKLVFLSDGSAMSQAETILDMVKHHRIGLIVGGASAGASGNVTQPWLPGGYMVKLSGYEVRKMDGSPLFGVGVLPDVPVERTIAGVRAGRDEILERGLVEALRAP